MPNHQRSATASFSDLLEIMHLLRQECPWDRQQTHESIKDLMIEEVYEAIDAIDKKNFDELRKELGDMLLHIVFHAEMAQEQQRFTMDDIIFTLQEKLIRRHPHVFAQTKVDSTDQVMRNWETIKMQETGKISALDGVPAHLPALLRAQRMQEKATNVGFDWPDWKECWQKLEEELQEFRHELESGSPELQKKEFGDVLFSMVNVGRFFKLDSEDALRFTNTKFQTRFQYIEQQAAKQGKTLHDMTLAEMDIIWNEAKTLE